MRIITLVENTTHNNNLKSIHGLCFYIETLKHKILFDLGPDETLLHNAKKLGIDLRNVDIVVISHSHNDHVGGIKAFLEVNNIARIFISCRGFDSYYVLENGIYRYIGIEKTVEKNERIVTVDQWIRIDEELQIYGNIPYKKMEYDINSGIKKKVLGQIQDDDFTHEQYLSIKEKETVLFVGCAHNGITNILDKMEIINQVSPKYVVGGFHICMLDTTKETQLNFLNRVAVDLYKKNSIYYTCHCTGEKIFYELQKVLGNRIEYVSVGCEIIL